MSRVDDEAARPLRVLVAGGGISGLATAYYLRRMAGGSGRQVEVVLFERESRMGGKIVTDRTDGFVIEGGPDSFLTTKPWAIALCRELGLGHRLIPTNPDQRSVYVLARGRLHPLPEGLRLVAPTRLWPFVRSDLISWPGKLRMALDLVLPPRRDGGDESIGAFVRRRLGREALVRLGEPLMAGIYVGDPDRLSLQATFPQFAALERRHGGVIRGLRAAAREAQESRRSGESRGEGAMFMSLIGGTAELVESLETALGPGVLRSGNGVAAIERVSHAEGGHGYRLRLDNGDTYDGDRCILATPAPVTARLLQSFDEDLSRSIAAIPHLSTATVSLGFSHRDVPAPLDGTGFVVARDEPLRIVACTWSSTKYAHRAPGGAVLLRAFVGGAGREEDVGLDDEALVGLVRSDLRRALGIAAAPVIHRVFRWHRANPQYEVGHLGRVAHIESRCPPGLHLVGAAYRGVGVPDCVHAGESVAQRALIA